MRITRLEIPDYKNLKGLCLKPDPDHMTTVVIGQNATGKSNLIEALVEIFRHLDLGEEPPENLKNYLLEYTCRGHQVTVKTENCRTQIEIKENGHKKQRKLSVGKFSREGEQFLPRNIFAYYSGRNVRLEVLFHEHQRQQYRKYRGETFITDTGQYSLRSDGIPMRRLFYCQNEHSQLILLTYLLELERNKTSNIKNGTPDIFKEYLGIEGLESALFVLRRPRAGITDVMREKGDERFWYATGVLAEFMDALWKKALAPIGHDLDKITDFRGHKSKQDTLYLYLDRKKLIEAADDIGDTIHFFRELESIYMADYLDEVRIQVRRTGVYEPLFFRELSEGEQQLMTVLGLIKFTRDEESLFLLDEPDTHINPIWKYNYFGMIDKLLGHSTDRRQKNQLFLTTHDPLMLGSLTKEQVRVLREVDGKVVAEPPLQDPRGIGFSGLLRSDMFGLRATVDPVTLSELDKRNELIAKRERGNLTARDVKKLEQLTTRLEDLGFSHDYRDPIFSQFIERMSRNRRLPLAQVLSKKQIEEEQKLADKISKDLIHIEQMNRLKAFAKKVKKQVRRTK